MSAAACGRSRFPAGGEAGDPGSATVLMLALAAAAIVLTVGLAGLGAAVAARHRAETAADLAALAGAGALQRGEPACAVVTGVALANGAVEVGCAVEGAEVVVRVGVDVGGAINLRARTTARAGPARRGPDGAGPVGMERPREASGR